VQRGGDILKKDSRTAKTLRNAKFSLAGQIIAIIAGYIWRSLFIRTMGGQYLGLNSLFTSILSALSFAELGVGSAITFNLYRTLAVGDTDRTRSFMHLYRNAYRIIGSLILVVGLSLAPFLDKIIKDIPDIPYVHWFYVIYVARSGCSYFFSYNRTIMSADQNGWINSSLDHAFDLLRQIIGIIAILLTHNYLIYLILLFALTLSENIVSTLIARHRYPYLKLPNPKPLPKEDMRQFAKKVTGLVVSKVAGSIISSTDSILISMFVGIASVGMYENYKYIISPIRAAISTIYSSARASFGHLHATESKERQVEVFYRIFFQGAMLASVGSICLLTISDPFMSWWVGKEYRLPISTVVIIVIHMYTSLMTSPIGMAHSAMGLFAIYRFRPLLGALVNLAASIPLARRFGIAGTIGGTLVSWLLCSFPLTPNIVFRHGYNESPRGYYLRFAKYAAVAAACAAAAYYACDLIEGSGLGIAAIKGVVTVAIVIPGNLLAFHRTKEFADTIILIKTILADRRKKRAAAKVG
jgi:O-antigen/teichoic acid export membrane protein